MRWVASTSTCRPRPSGCGRPSTPRQPRTTRCRCGVMFHAALFMAIVLSAVGMGLSLAHALELPGKRRLSRDAYFAVQTIYYPGFTIGGALGEPLAIVAALLTVLFTVPGSQVFWLILSAVVCLLFEHALYWLVTHPVNKVWLRDQTLGGSG